MKKKLLITLSLISFCYQYSFFYTYWIKDELVNYNPMIANIYWITAGLFGILLGIYGIFKYKVKDSAFYSAFITLFAGLPILGLFVLASFITSM